MSNVLDLQQPITRPAVAEMQERIHDVIKEYDGEVGFIEALGALEFLKIIMTARQIDNIES